MLHFEGPSDYDKACQPLVRQLGRSLDTVALVVVGCFAGFATRCLPLLVDDWWADPEVDRVTGVVGGTEHAASSDLVAALTAAVTAAAASGAPEQANGPTGDASVVVCTIRMMFAREKRFVLVVVAPQVDAAMAARRVLGRLAHGGSGSSSGSSSTRDGSSPHHPLGGGVDAETRSETAIHAALTGAEAVHFLVACEPSSSSSRRAATVVQMLKWCCVASSSSSSQASSSAVYGGAAQLLVESGAASCAEATNAAVSLADAHLQRQHEQQQHLAGRTADPHDASPSPHGSCDSGTAACKASGPLASSFERVLSSHASATHDAMCSPSGLRQRRKAYNYNTAGDSALSPLASGVFSPDLAARYGGRLPRPSPMFAAVDAWTDRLRTTQTLRRMALCMAEQVAVADLLHTFVGTMCVLCAQQDQRAAATMADMLAALGAMLSERDDALGTLLSSQESDVFAAFHAQPSYQPPAGGMPGPLTPRGESLGPLNPREGAAAAGTYDLPTLIAAGRRRTLSGASAQGGAAPSLLNDSIVSSPTTRGRSATTLMDAGLRTSHQLVPSSAQSMPLAHRHLLASGSNAEIDSRRKHVDPSKVPPMKVSVLQQESQHWRPNSQDLDEYKRMAAYELFLLGEPGVGKSSVAACLARPAPRFFKKVPEVGGPTIVATTQAALVAVAKGFPTLAVPHGGVKFSHGADPTRVVRDAGLSSSSSGVQSCGMRLTELPTSVLRGLALPGMLPCKGAVYVAVYDLRERRDVARRAVEAMVQHVVAIASACPALSLSEQRQVPFFLLGTHRDLVPKLCNPDDPSAVLTLLRSQRDWFEGLLAACAHPDGPLLLLLDNAAVSCADWTVTGERPQSAASFEAMLHDAAKFLALSAPTNPQHLLPTAALLLEDEPAVESTQSFQSMDDNGGGLHGNTSQPRLPNTIDTFWSQHGVNRSQSSLSAATPSGVLHDQVHRWLRSSAVGVVTLLTSLCRCAEFSTTVCDSQTLTNAVLQHFELTIEHDHATDGLLHIRNMLVEYFIAQLEQRGIVRRVATGAAAAASSPSDGSEASASVLCTLRLTWLLDAASCVMLPATLQLHSDLPAAGPELQQLLARVGHRAPAQLLAKASQVLGIGSLATDVAQLQLYKRGIVAMALLQRAASRYLRPAVAATDTALALVRMLGVGIAAEDCHRRYGPTGSAGPLAIEPRVFPAASGSALQLAPSSPPPSAALVAVPAAAKKASLVLLNLVGYTAQVVFDHVTQTAIAISCLPLNLPSSIVTQILRLHFAQTGGGGHTADANSSGSCGSSVHEEADVGPPPAFFVFQNALLLCAPGLWAVIAEDPDVRGSLQFVSSTSREGEEGAESLERDPSRATSYLRHVVAEGIAAAVQSYGTPAVTVTNAGEWADEGEASDASSEGVAPDERKPVTAAAAAPAAVVPWADVESNVRTLVYQAAAEAARDDARSMADRVLGVVRRMYEHTAPTDLCALMHALDELW